MLGKMQAAPSKPCPESVGEINRFVVRTEKSRSRSVRLPRCVVGKWLVVPPIPASESVTCRGGSQGLGTASTVLPEKCTQGEDQNGDTDSETGIGGTVTLVSGLKIKRLARRRRSFMLLVVLVRIFL